jgi:hypothetical protein
MKLNKKHLILPALLFSYVIMPTVTMWLIGALAALSLMIILITVFELNWIDRYERTNK